MTKSSTLDAHTPVQTKRVLCTLKRSFFRQGLRVEGKELRCRWWLAYRGHALDGMISPPHPFFPWHKRTPCLWLSPSCAVTHLETALSSERTWCGAQAPPSLSTPAELSCATFFSFWKTCAQFQEPEADGTLCKWTDTDDAPSHWLNSQFPNLPGASGWNAMPLRSWGLSEGHYLRWSEITAPIWELGSQVLGKWDEFTLACKQRLGFRLLSRVLVLKVRNPGFKCLICPRLPGNLDLFTYSGTTSTQLGVLMNLAWLENCEFATRLESLRWMNERKSWRVHCWRRKQVLNLLLSAQYKIFGWFPQALNSRILKTRQS